MTSGAVASYGLRKRVEAVRNCRDIGKQDMKFNDSTPKMKVDPETYVRLQFLVSRTIATEVIWGASENNWLLGRRSRWCYLRCRTRGQATSCTKLLRLLNLLSMLLGGKHIMLA